MTRFVIACLKDALCMTLSALLVLQPMIVWADGITVDSAAAAANRATLGSAPNGVPVVNIVAPNASGLSHNKFTDFNVGSKGVVLNNSAEVGVSQLGGVLMENTNLGGVEASKILNEVTSTNRSVLEGFTEIFGGKADYILANPNGITCDGCGFINTPRATLTTGDPTFNPDGSLKGLLVDKGDVLIDGLGLNASDIDYFDIVARSTTINARLNAKSLNITSGRNDYDYATRNATALADDASAKPTYALDSTALGGMYAGRITLVGTEAGVGVNMVGDMAASTSDMTITADGKIVLNKASAAGNVEVASASDNVQLDGQVYASNNLTVTANNGTVDVNDTTAGAANNVTINATSLDSTNATIAAGLQSGGTIQSGTGDLTATVTGTITTTGGKVVAGRDVTINTATLANTGATIAASGNAAITADNITAGDGTEKLSTGGSLTVTANNSGTLTGEASATSAMTITGNALALNTSTIETDNTLTVTATNGLSYKGDLTSTGKITLTAGTFAGDAAAGDVSSQSDIEVNGAGTVIGDLLAKGAIDINGSNLTLETGLIQAGTTLDVTDTGTLSYDGDMTAGGNLSLDANVITGQATAGMLTTQANLNINTSTSGNVTGNLVAGTDINLTGASLTLDSSTIDATQDVVATVARLVNNAAFEAGGNVTVNNTSFTNNATIEATGGYSVTTSSSFNNATAAKLLTDGTASVTTTGGTFVNDGEVSGQTTEITTAGTLSNTANGVIASGSTTTINSAGDISNAGRISATTDLAMTAPNITNTGTLSAGNDVIVTTTGDMATSNFIFAANDINLRIADDFTNTNGNLWAANNITIDADGAGTKNNAITNSSGTIETQTGNITFYTTALVNERSNFNVTELVQVSSGTTTVTGPTDPAHVTYSNQICARDIGCRPYDITTTTTTTTVYEDQASSSTPEASIIAGGNIDFQATSTTNKASTIHANGNLNIVGDTLSLTGYSLRRKTTLSWTSVRTKNDTGYNNEGDDYYWITWTWSSSGNSSTTETYATTPSILSANQNFTGSFIDRIDNISIIEGAAEKAISAGSASVHKTSTDIGLPTITDPDVSLVNDVDEAIIAGEGGGNVVIAGINVSTGTSGMFVLNRNPDSKYLVESNPQYASMVKVLGSDYFLEKVLPDFNAAAAPKRLGDAIFETQMIRQQIFQTTGSRFLNDTITSDYDQMQSLMDNAVQAGKDLELSVGVALSEDQVAALTNDMIWMVEKELAGQKVLVPVLYLSQLTRDNIDSSGAIITANKVDINAGGDIKNSGTIKSKTDLAMTAGGALDNKYGQLAANDNLTVTAKDDVNNTGGLIQAGGDAEVTSTDGSIIVETEVAEVGRVGYGGTLYGDYNSVTLDLDGKQDFTRVGSNNDGTTYAHVKADRVETIQQLGARGRIKSGGELKLNAGKDISVKGGEIKAGGDADINANGNVVVSAVSVTKGEVSNRIVNGRRVGNLQSKSTTTFEGGKITSGGNLSVNGSESVVVSTDGKKPDYVRKDASLRETSILHEASTLKAENDVNITSSGNVLIKGGEVKGGDDVNVTALGDVDIETTKNETDLEDGHKGKKSKYYLKQTKKTVQRTKIAAGNDLTVRSLIGDVNVTAAKLESGGTTTLDASLGKVALLTDKDSDYEEKHVVKSGFVKIKTTDSGHHHETVKHTEIDAGNGLVIKSGNDIVVEYRGDGGLDGAVEALSKQPGLAWMKDAIARDDVAWKAVMEAHEEWSHTTSSINPAMMTMVAMAMSFVVGPYMMGVAQGLTMTSTQAILANGAVMSMSQMSAIGMSAAQIAATSALSAGMTTLASQAAVALVGNEGNIGAALKQMTSSASLRSLATAMVTAGVMGGISAETGFDKISNSPDIFDQLQAKAVRTLVSSATDAAINGGDFGDSLKSGLINAGTAALSSFAANKIGALGLADGSPLKAALHAAAGGLIAEMTGKDFAAGAIGGATAEIIGTQLATIDDPQMRSLVTSGIAQMGALLAGGDSEDIAFAGQTAQLVMTYNHYLHPQFKELMSKELESKKKENPELYDSISEADLKKYEDACGVAHCFKTDLDSGEPLLEADTSKLRLYFQKEGIEFSEEGLLAFGNISQTVQNNYEATIVARMNDIGDGEFFLPDYNIDTVPFYMPDANDDLAGKYLKEKYNILTGEVPHDDGYIDAEITRINDRYNEIINNNPIYDAVGFREATDNVLTESNREFIKFGIGMLAPELAEAALSSMLTRLVSNSRTTANAIEVLGTSNCVYSCVINGTTRYVGITNNIARRGAQHFKDKGIFIEEIEGLSNLSRVDARAVEQVLIEYHGLGKDGGTLINKINSISAIKNKTIYEESMVKGAELLKGIGYEGFK